MSLSTPIKDEKNEEAYISSNLCSKECWQVDYDCQQDDRQNVKGQAPVWG